MNKTDRIFVAGHRGLVGSSILRRLVKEGYSSLITATSSELDLRDQTKVHAFFKEKKIDYVFLAAAKVGGIHANKTLPADFLYDNLMITTNILHASANYDVKKVLNLGSSCIYPREAPQPMSEECLLTGKLEPTNEGYAIAKIAGLKLCQFYQQQYGKNFVSVMPTNLYGIHDNFHPLQCHVLPGLLRRFHDAKLASASEVVVWGTGKPFREFLYADDLTDALMLVMEEYDSPEILNIGYGSDIPIAEMAEIVKKVTGFQGRIVFDTSKPDGSPRKLINSSRIFEMGWKPQTTLLSGLEKTYQWALQNGTFESPPTGSKHNNASSHITP